MITRTTFAVGLIAAFAMGLSVGGRGAESLSDQYLEVNGDVYRFPGAVKGRVEVLDRRTGEWVIFSDAIRHANAASTMPSPR